MSDLDLAPPAGASGDDLLTVEAQVRAVDAQGRLVQVRVRGADLWLPAVAGRYMPTGESGVSLAQVLLDPASGAPVLVLGPLTPRAAQAPATMTSSTVTDATVLVDGVTYVLPYLASTYGALPAAVWVSLDDWGLPTLVLGPSAVAAPPAPPPPPPPDEPSVVRAVAVIVPQWSGTWRASRGAWDRWNADVGRYGGRSTLYQGSSFGSGPLTGLATYGDQIVNLGATSIERIEVAVRSVGLASGSPPVTVQGSPHGAPPGGAPSSSGDTASGMGGLVNLPPSTREAMRTGAVKGLALVGGPYSAAAGAGSGDGMALTVTYTRPS